MHLSVTPRPQNALLRRMRFSSPGQTRRRLTEKRTLAPVPHVKAHSVPTASRKSALCLRTSPKDALCLRASPKDAFCMRAVPQTALFRESAHLECVFPSHRDHRMRFSVECAFSHLRKRRVTSRKSALCPRCLTEKRILKVSPSRKSAFCAHCLTEKHTLPAHLTKRRTLHGEHASIPSIPTLDETLAWL